MDDSILIFVIVGFIAQMIDGALGMAYGVSSTSFMLATGVPPVTASASVHAAEVFTTFVSGTSHFKLGNVNRELLVRLAIPGSIGGVLGALVLTSVPAETIKPVIAMYLFCMGLYIVWRALHYRERNTRIHRIRHVAPLGFAGGMLDATGGGGWGPVVTSTLLAGGNAPAETIGSVSASEFFVTLVQSAAFFLLIGSVPFHAVAGLIIGGVIAAPFAALLVKRAKPRRLMFIVGILICVLQIRTLMI
ncbi:MAG: hypothetical protein TR69_WS6001001310 [candidate division WS6 bacterium OLB20]|uniref:Probable membrane transporter protein n=1 Tax=candidate division WS6 bacterium OLB20 TaxID=1617426 RepID=A0A136LWM9_9BACT|nr:MAG: hypothetical protein TR69_WS6001001310 [candidate division WS6 bacterium OLB20]